MTAVVNPDVRRQDTLAGPLDPSGQSLLRKTGWSVLGSLASLSSRFVVGIVAARLLGPAGTGRLAYLLWAAETVNVVASLGLQNSAARFVADLRGQGRANEASRLARWLYTRYLALAMVSAALIAAGLPRAGSAPGGGIWYAVGAYVLAQGLGNFYIAYLSGMQRFDSVARLNFVSSLTLVAATVTGAALFGVEGAVAGYLAAALPPAVMGLAVLRRASGAQAPQRLLRRRCLRYAMFTWLAALVSAIVWSRIEVFFIERYWDMHAVAMFVIGLSLSSLVTQGPLLATGPLMPHFAGLAGARDRVAIRATYANGTRLLALTLFPMCLGLASIAPAMLPLLYGAAFAPAVPSAVVLIAFSALSFGNVGSALVYGMEKSYFIAATGAAGAVLSLTSCLLVIPHWGTWGAVWCRAGVQTTMILLGLWYIGARLSCPVPFRALAKTLLAAGLSAICSYLTVRAEPGLTGMAVAIPTAACVYLALIRALRLVRGEDLDWIESALSRLRLPMGPRSAVFLRWLVRAS